MTERIPQKHIIMDLLFELLGLFFVLLGIVGSFLPVLPGPITGWVGLLLLHQSSRIEDNSTFLIVTLIISLAVFLLEYIMYKFSVRKILSLPVVLRL